MMNNHSVFLLYYHLVLVMKYLILLKLLLKELQDLMICKVIWDIDDLSKIPPWGNIISDDITNLSNYFVTSDGEDFITIFLHALEKALNLKTSIEIKSI